MSTGTKRAKTAPGEGRRKKNFRLHQPTIDRVMEILGTETETEAITQALDMIVFQQEMLDAMDGMYGAGVVNLFDEEAGAEVRD